MTIKLQLALDFRSLQDAMKVADACERHVDIIEAGTPLIKSEGMQAVRVLKDRHPQKMVVADMKTMDTGAFEAQIAFSAGADVTTVLGAADRQTIKGASDAARKAGRMLMVDTIGIDDLSVLKEKLSGIYFDYLAVHCGIDQQKVGMSPFSMLQQAIEIFPKAKIAVAGGIDANRAGMLSAYPGVEIAIVGGAITGAKDPGKAAEEIRRRL
ncbi:MAG: 3-hexulose-6-phosphate synthase [Candidatus Aenigmatarchaeota archaeon]